VARGLKSKGLEESKSLRQRVIRQHGLGRIRKSDADYLIDLLNKFEARVVHMPEQVDDDEYEKEL
jgi:hypothetical protein